MINDGWAILSVVGFWGWVLATAGFILKGFPDKQRFETAPAFRWGGGVLIFFLIWFIGMVNA